MTDTTTFVAIQVPYLRRFARVLTGSQTVADGYVQAVMEAMIKEPPLDDEANTRQWLYRSLLTLWTCIENEGAEPEGDPDTMMSSADFNLMAIAPLPRAAFLLQSMEAFRVDQVADILRRSSIEAENLIDQAGEELAAQISTDVLSMGGEPSFR